MEQIITTTVVTLISGAIGAIIGTYGGALFAAKRQEKHIKELRQVAIKALKIFQKYARNKQTYDVAASEFNNALREFLLLHYISWVSLFWRLQILSLTYKILYLKKEK